jgi:hypothetical protein
MPHKHTLLQPVMLKLRVLVGTCVMLVFAWIARRYLLSALSYLLAGVLGHVIFSACLLNKTPADSEQHEELSLLRLVDLDLVLRRVVGSAIVGSGQQDTDQGGNVQLLDTGPEPTAIQATDEQTNITQIKQTGRLDSIDNIDSTRQKYLNIQLEPAPTERSTHSLCQPSFYPDVDCCSRTWASQTNKVLPSLETRLSVLQMQSMSAKLQSFDRLSNELRLLLAKMSPDNYAQAARGIVGDAQTFQTLTRSVTNSIYSKRDQPLLQAWWHDPRTPTTLSHVDLHGLTL